jgi:hypothetical protein
MAETEDLYTDYAIQIFSSYMIEDINSMTMVLESFKNDGKDVDDLFLPGLIYGLLYHLGTFIRLVSNATDVPVEKLLSDYAMDYAIAREQLLLNPLLNVNKAKDLMKQMIKELELIEEIYKELPDSN